MSKKILFVGAGAIGSYLGAFLSRAGHAVTLIDAWAEQVDTINRKGIDVTGPHDPFNARPAAVHLHESQRLPRDFDTNAFHNRGNDYRGLDSIHSSRLEWSWMSAAVCVR